MFSKKNCIDIKIDKLNNFSLDDPYLELCALYVEYEPVDGGVAQGGQQRVQGDALVQHRGGRLLGHYAAHGPE